MDLLEQQQHLLIQIVRVLKGYHLAPLLDQLGQQRLVLEAVVFPKHPLQLAVLVELQRQSALEQ